MPEITKRQVSETRFKTHVDFEGGPLLVQLVHLRMDEKLEQTISLATRSSEIKIPLHVWHNIVAAVEEMRAL